MTAQRLSVHSVYAATMDAVIRRAFWAVLVSEEKSVEEDDFSFGMVPKTLGWSFSDWDLYAAKISRKLLSLGYIAATFAQGETRKMHEKPLETTVALLHKKMVAAANEF